jgi:phosphoglycerate kinase
MKTIDNFNFAGHTALIRVDFNVPLDKQFNITDDSRIKGSVPTLTKILNDGGNAVLMSHLGRPLKKLKDDGSVDRQKFSLNHVVKRLSELLSREIKFADDCLSDQSFELSRKLKTGEVLLLENLRFYKEEEKGDERFAEKLSKHGNVYVNDAFGTAHRAHASTAVIAKFFPGKKFFGYLMADEIKNADKIMKDPQHPFTAVMGGAKVSDKILLIESLISKADNILIGGGMAYTFFKAMNGNIGSSLVEEDKLDLAKNLLQQAKEKNCNLLLPVDSIAADKFDNDANTTEVDNTNISPGWMGLDIGPKATKEFCEIISKSRAILWNGPMGVFEMDRFETGTRKMAEAIAEATTNGAYSLIGGGDSAAAINKFRLSTKVSYVSTGGGALLEYVEGKELPGVKAILS